MSTTFKKGDKVIRIKGGVNTLDDHFKDGQEYVVESCIGSFLYFAGRSNAYDAKYFRISRPAHTPMLLAQDAQERKDTPITSGVLDYFPLALAAVAKCSKAGNDQHNPGQPLHWAKGKSTDHADCIARHLIDRKSVDTDGIPHDVKLAWRALALLQTRLESETK